jgi:hypothetical protein
MEIDTQIKDFMSAMNEAPENTKEAFRNFRARFKQLTELDVNRGFSKKIWDRIRFGNNYMPNVAAGFERDMILALLDPTSSAEEHLIMLDFYVKFQTLKNSNINSRLTRIIAIFALIVSIASLLVGLYAKK